MLWVNCISVYNDCFVIIRTAMTFTKVVLPEYCSPTSVSSISSFQNKLLIQSRIRLIKANIFVKVQRIISIKVIHQKRLFGKSAYWYDLTVTYCVWLFQIDKVTDSSFRGVSYVFFNIEFIFYTAIKIIKL